MTAAPFFHVGILVNDLDAAIKRFSEVMDVSFVEPVVAHVDYLEESWRTSPCDLRVAYTNQGPPYIELLEAQGDGIYGVHQGEGVHHVGVWDPDCEARLEALQKRGMRTEAIQFTPDRRIIVAYFYPGHLHGTRLEIVDEGRREMMERWFAGAPFID